MRLVTSELLLDTNKTIPMILFLVQHKFSYLQLWSWIDAYALVISRLQVRISSSPSRPPP